MSMQHLGTLLAAVCLAALGLASRGKAGESPSSLRIGVCQIGLEATLAANRDKIAAFIDKSKARGCRVVVFPETSLYAPPGTPAAEIDAAVESLRKAMDVADLYALIGGTYQRDGQEKP